ncbi:hypothetical protein [Caulobacter sp. SSI4214]|jgi:hypothetical protein|uniref:hypothetical protein n=1 Tax=Caulobacter sp. SSI4214 TaxID=2575739 RepID=UPI00143A46E8|nr:hypothetical protein [Caulobacter sp. SSI4214]
MKPRLGWKSVCAAIAMAALANGLMVAAPAAAGPSRCVPWAYAMCDADGLTRGTPEYDECFAYYSTEGCAWWPGPGVTSKTPIGVKLDDLQALARQ